MITAYKAKPGQGMQYQRRDYTPSPLAYPYKPFTGAIPQIVLDRLSFAAFSARASGVDLGVFMIRSWEDFRFPHVKMLHALLDLGFVRRAVDPVYGNSWSWVFASSAERPERSEDAPQDKQKPQNFNVDLSQPLFSSVVVAPKISPMGWTAP